MGSSGSFINGAVIAKTGIYGVQHSPHRLPKQVFLAKDGMFPRCSKCTDTVIFTPVLTSSELLHDPVHVHQLPVIDEDEAAS